MQNLQMLRLHRPTKTTSQLLANCTSSILFRKVQEILKYPCKNQLLVGTSKAMEPANQPVYKCPIGMIESMNESSYFGQVVYIFNKESII